MKPKVLFLCTGNSARSQMAEGYLRHIAGDRFDVVSAGTEPKGLNPLAIRAMCEIGIDISHQHSKDVRDFAASSIQFVVTVCANAQQRCPIFPSTIKNLHWDLDDPAAAQGDEDARLQVFRRVRDEIVGRIEQEFSAPGETDARRKSGTGHAL